LGKNNLAKEDNIMNNVINDIKIICKIGYNSNISIILFDQYSLYLIKSSKNFDSKNLFQIKKIIIEGLYISECKKFHFQYYNGKRNGRFCTYHDNNNKKINLIGNNKDNHFFGKILSYHDNGQKKSEFYYNEFKFLEGLFLEWNTLGNKITEINYKNNVYDGEYKTFHNNGNKSHECFYENNKKEGIFKNYYDNGKLFEEINYKNDIKEGLYKIYDENGILIFEKKYKDDKEINFFLFYIKYFILYFLYNYYFQLYYFHFLYHFLLNFLFYYHFLYFQFYH
jgi:antitoxin component YwqK of YwqJK toxin-antitoxin module